MLRDDVVFAVEGEQYRWRDVVLAAVRWSDWSAMERRAREGFACASHAAATGTAVPPDALDEAGREFRYARDLLTARSMEQWLERWDMTVQEWTAFFARDLHRQRSDGDVATLVDRYPVDAADLPRMTLIEAVCSGALGRWKKKLAARAAVHAALGKEAGEASTPPTSATPAQVPDRLLGVLGIDAATAADALARLAGIDESFNRFRASQVTERALKEHVGNRQLDWMRFNCRIMAFPDESMASEAALLLTEDNEGFTGVYSAAHAEPRAARFFLDEIDAGVRDRFVGARAGDLVGPLRVKDEYALYLVMEKSLPSVSDPDVRQRAEEGVLKGLLDRQVSNRVRWREASAK